MNYIVSAATLLLVIILFVRTVLPRSAASMTLADEIDPKTTEFRLTVLSMNSTDYTRRGGGLAVRQPIKEVKKFLKYAEKKLKAGKRLENFEQTIYKNISAVKRAIDIVEKQSPLFFGLPHCGNYPRLYELCSLIVKGNGGYADKTSLQSAVNIFNEHSPLLYCEILALKAMLTFCAIEQIAVLCAKSEQLSNIVARADYDAERERIDLTSLKRNAYVFHYCERIDGSIARKFSAICAENGIDVWKRSKVFENELSDYAAVAYAAAQTLNEMDVWLSEDFCNSLYAGYNAFASAYGADFERLTVDEKKTRLNAFSVYCRRKKLDEITEIKKLSRVEARSATEKVSPPVIALVLLSVAAIAVGIMPAVLAAIFLPSIVLPCALLTLPVTLSAVFTALRFTASSTYEGVKLSAVKAETGTARKVEFAEDYALKMPRKSAKNTGENIAASSRLNVFYNAVSLLNRAISDIASLCALALVFIAPLYSPRWLFAAFARDIICFLFELRASLRSEQAVFSKIAATLFAAFELPVKAVKVFVPKGRNLPGAVAVATQIVAAAILTATALFADYAIAYYVIAAAFAIVPLASYVSANLSKKSVAAGSGVTLTDNDKEKTYGNRGIYPRVRFLRGERYIATVSDGGDVYDFFDGKPLFDKMKSYLLKNGEKIPFDIASPFKVTQGRAVNEAVADGRRFTVTTASCEDGKRITIKAKDGGDFTAVIAHSVFGKCLFEKQMCELQGLDCALLTENADSAPRCVCVAVRKSARMSITVDEGEFLYGCENGIASVLALTVSSESGIAEAVFIAGYDSEQASKTVACAFKNGYDKRIEAKTAALAELAKNPFDISQTASFILYGRCRYPDTDLQKIIDLNLNTLLCYQRSGGGLSRLHGKLKGLADLKKTGLKFNVAVLCFDESGGGKTTRNKVNLMFEEFGLNRHGRAVCFDCEANEKFYEALKYAAPDIDSLRFIARTPNPELKACKKTSGILEYPLSKIKGDAMSVAEDGKIICDGFGASGGAENRLTNKLGMCSQIRADGGGYTFFDNPWNGKVTQENNALDSVPSEFIAFSETGRLWSATALPLGVRGETFCLHGENFSEYVCVTNGLNISQKVFVSDIVNAKVWNVEIENTRKSARKIYVTACVRPVLGESGDSSRSCLSLSDTSCGISAVNILTKQKICLETDAKYFSRSQTLESLLGENGRICKLSEIKSGGTIPAMILCAEIKLTPLSSARVSFSLSVEESFDFQSSESDMRVNPPSPFTFSTGDWYTDTFVASLPQRILSSLLCKPVLREGESFEGEHYASALLKGAALLPENKELFKKIILKSCSKRFSDGDIVLFKRGDGGKRAACHSASLFLPLAVARYIDFTDERDILFERAGYVRTDKVGGEKRASVLEHCLQTVEACCGEDTVDCFNIASELLLLKAIAALMPYVKDSETRLKLSDEKLKVSKRLENVDSDSLSAESLCWLVFCGIGKQVNSERLLKRMRERSDNENMKRLWICAALAEMGDTQTAYDVFQTVNPLGAEPYYMTEKGFRTASDESEALAYIIVSELFFGCKIKGDSLVFAPKLPPSIKKARVKYDCDVVRFETEIDNTGKGNWRVMLDGISYNCDSVPLTEKTNGKKIVLKRR